MPAPERLPQAQIDRIVDLARNGTPRNQIARDVGVSAATVTKYAHAAGVTFDRAATRDATAASQADSAERRARIAADLLDLVGDGLRDVKRARRPKDDREREYRSRSIAQLARSFAETTKTAPLPDTSAHEVTQALRDFRQQLLTDSDTHRRLEAYEARYGRLEDNEIPDDTYGQAAP